MHSRIPRQWVLLAGALLLLPRAASAQQTYRITLKQPAKDETALYRKLARFRVALTITDSNNKTPGTLGDERSQDLVYLEEVLAKPAGAGKGPKVRRRYRRAEQLSDREKQIMPHLGKPILIEEVGGSYQFHLEDGKKVPGVAEDVNAAMLDWEFNRELPPLPRLGAPWLLPQTTVKVGESWRLDPTPFVEDLRKLAMKLEPGRATGTGKLLRTYRSGGRQQGVLDLRIEVPIKSFDLMGATVRPKDSKAIFHMVVDACIDGSSYTYRLKGSMVWEIDATLGERDSQGRILGRAQTDFFESRQEPARE
jgi:hypothetical protein